MVSLRRSAALSVPAACLIIAGAMPSAREAGCPVQGVWELASMTSNGKEEPLSGYKTMKIVTKRYWMWIGQNGGRDTLPMNTLADTLRKNFIGGGAGQYTAKDNVYIEHIDYFNDPTWLGKPWKATCRVEGNRWYHSFPYPQDTTGVPRDSIARIVEVWRRVE